MNLDLTPRGQKVKMRTAHARNQFFLMNLYYIEYPESVKKIDPEGQQSNFGPKISKKNVAEFILY
jgi:hypothetical protein